MLPVVWSSEALDDLDGIAAFISESNPAAAAALVVRIEDVTEPLSLFPYWADRGGYTAHANCFRIRTIA